MSSSTQSSSMQVSSSQPDSTKPAFGLYIHIPFCAHKCPYCDFNTYAGLGALYEQTVDALCTELAAWGEQLAGRAVTSVFVGGGTPTVLSDGSLSVLLETLQARFTLSADCEITVEANPGTVDRDKFRLLHALGVNRLSIGVQSFQPDELAFLGRIHDIDDVYGAFESARAAGFDNVSLDFIFGLPGQSPERWEDTLIQALALEPEHLSLYSLIVEPDTPLNQWVESGRVDMLDEDHAGELYEIALERLQDAGYVHYEVSNWTKTATGEELADSRTPGIACRHNLLYWRNGEYVGIGPGAHSHMRQRNKDERVTSRRWSNQKSVPEYVSGIEEQGSIEVFSELVGVRESMGETMMLGLRLVREGVSYQRFEELYGVALVDVFGRELLQLQGQGLVEADGVRVRLTPRGLMIGNQVFLAFLPNVTETAAA